MVCDSILPAFVASSLFLFLGDVEHESSHCGRSPISHPQLVVDALQVFLDGGRLDSQPPCNLPIRQPFIKR